jgi:serine/threonine protein kinase/Tol biopolymer transport system component
MPLIAGSRLGAYEIQSPLGAGGMGEVYRARDTRLEREVAIKVLPEHLSQKPDARERFEREARAVSSLGHPNICHLYDVGQHDGISYLVMEYLQGETLADRLRKGPLPLEQVLKVGVETCEGLEKAHRSGVVHRDLKPSNIMLTKTGAKLMDFGLAKTTVPIGESSASLATMSRPLTTEGTIVGTFQYMSPEQVEGGEADVRSDIFALGAVLYEMITGQRAFEGKTTASTIAAILAGEPKPISTLQPMSPPAYESLVKACLAKDPDERLQTVHDVKLQLKWIAESDSKVGVPAHVMAKRKRWDRAGWLLAAFLLLVVTGGSATWWILAHHKAPAMFFNSSVPFAASDVTLSPDGRVLAMVAYWDQANKNMIWIQAVGGRAATTLPGTEDALHPFWSPDGRSIGFFSQGKLKTVEVNSGRSAQVLCDAPHGRGGAWNRDGVILFSPEGYGALYKVSSGGDTPTQVTKVDASRSEWSHRWPVFLPDGRHFLYLAANFSGHPEKNEIFVGTLDSAERWPVVSASSNAAYADPGYLLYVRDNALVAQKFDLGAKTLVGEPHTVSDTVQYLPIIDLGIFDVAGTGVLVAQTGTGAAKSQMMWFDRNGKPVGTVGPPGLAGNVNLSPDGQRVAVDQTDTDGRHVNIWIYGLGSEASRLTFSLAADQLPIWSPDGRVITFGSNQKLHFVLYQKNSDGSGSPREFADLGIEELGPWNWSHDGKYLLVLRNADLWYLALPDRQPKPFVQSSGSVRNGQFSPDGKWVAYSSNESGNWEVYVSPFPNGASKWQVSRAGGEEPRWRRDGKELFYLSAEGKMMAVAVKTGTNFEAGSPVTLFQTRTRQPVSFMDAFSYDVTGDGQKFLINTRVDERNAAPLSVVLNWASEMEK